MSNFSSKLSKNNDTKTISIRNEVLENNLNNKISLMESSLNKQISLINQKLRNNNNNNYPQNIKHNKKIIESCIIKINENDNDLINVMNIINTNKEVIKLLTNRIEYLEKKILENKKQNKLDNEEITDE